MKKILNIVSGSLALTGFIIIVGTADNLELKTIFLRAVLGISFILSGYIGLKLGGCKYVD